MPIKESYEKALRRTVESAPYYQLLQITLEQIDEGFAQFRMPFRKELTHPYGIVHGGAIASLADTAVAFALMTMIQPGERVPTVEFKINFFSSVHNGEMIGEARIVNKGRSLVMADMEVKNKDGKLIAKGLATYMILSSPQTVEE
ncbi:MAG: PaaI family thioesterase [Thermodesulfobacteriota bacterium]|nr:PaaI family thioesterase [Thermodesulfobacteriota bacterium]